MAPKKTNKNLKKLTQNYETEKSTHTFPFFHGIIYGVFYVVCNANCEHWLCAELSVHLDEIVRHRFLHGVSSCIFRCTVGSENRREHLQVKKYSLDLKYISLQRLTFKVFAIYSFRCYFCKLFASKYVK